MHAYVEMSDKPWQGYEEAAALDAIIAMSEVHKNGW
jgi:hypothetical protein